MAHGWVRDVGTQWDPATCCCQYHPRSVQDLRLWAWIKTIPGEISPFYHQLLLLTYHIYKSLAQLLNTYRTTVSILISVSLRSCYRKAVSSEQLQVKQKPSLRDEIFMRPFSLMFQDCLSFLFFVFFFLLQ